VDERADVFALGACLYNLLSGTTPHGDGTSEELLDRAEGPVRPLDQVVRGVPPEVLAICAKALAHDPGQRYPDAAALGAELRRFLAGQLVAAYRYSPAQRIKRFVVRHRVAVVATLAAVTIIATVTAIAAARVIDERDRARLARTAEEEARRDAEDRAEGLILAQASALAPTEPAAAIGLLRQLSPGSRRWPEARSVATAAAARGIPWGHQSHSDFVISMRAAPGGAQILSASRDGRLVLHEVARRAARELAALGSLRAAEWLGPGTITAQSEGALILLDVETASQQEVQIPSPVKQLEGSAGGQVVMLQLDDGRFGVWRAGEPAPSFTTLPGEGAVNLELSPDGTLVAISSRRLVELRRVDDLRAAPLTTFGPDARISFSAARATFAVVSPELIRTFAIAGDLVSELWRIPVATAGRAAFVGDDLYFVEFMNAAVHVAGPGGLTQLAVPRQSVVPASVTSCGAALCVAHSDGLIRVVHPTGVVELHAGVHSSLRLAATPEALAVSGHGAILVWQLASLLPRLVPMPPGATVRAVAGEAAILQDNEQVLTMALDDGTVTPLGPSRPFSRLLIDEGASDRVLLLESDGRLVLLSEGRPRALLQLEVGAATWIGRDRILLSKHDGQLVELDLSAERLEILVPELPDGVMLAGRGSWRAVLTRSRVWRLDRASGREESHELSAQTLELADSGVVYLSQGERILSWPPGGTPTELARLESPPRSMLAHHLGVLVVTADNSLIRVARSGAAPPELILARSGFSPRLTPDGRFALGRLGADLVVVDVELGRSWSRPAMGDSHALSDDGRVLVSGRQGLLAVWRDEVPGDPRQLQEWLARATNAMVGRTGKVAWPAVAEEP
jgi:hypothetical protein